MVIFTSVRHNVMALNSQTEFDLDITEEREQRREK